MTVILFETSTALAANGTYDSSASGTVGIGGAMIRDTGSIASGDGDFNSFGAYANSDVPGTLYIDGSFDRITWRTQGVTAVTGGSSADIAVPIRFRYYRVRYVNGPTATTPGAFSIHASLQSGNGVSSPPLTAQFWTERATNLNASEVFNGTGRLNGGVAGGLGSRFNWFVAEVHSDVGGGTLYIDRSVDGGTTWRQTASVASVANTTASLAVRVTAPLYRSRFVNAATVTTAFLLTDAYTAS